MSKLLASLAKPSLNWLLVFFPVAIVLEVAHKMYHATWATPTLIFAASAVAIIPIAGWMGHATEHLATRLGEGIGGLLNATFGNAAELIIAIMALRQAMVDPESVRSMHALIKASITGSIIGNILLVLGAALLAGGLRHKIQKFNATAGRVNATLLTLAVIALLIPAVTELVIKRGAAEQQRILGAESLEVSILLLFVYALSLLFSLHTHKHFYSGGTAEAEQDVHGGSHEDGHAPWSVAKAMGVLVGATVGVAILAEFMVGSVQATAQAIGLTEVFVGVIVVAIVGNAAEHSTAILVAWNNRMDLSLAIAVGSSIQIALFVAPALVLLSYAMGVPMNLVFTVPEIAAVAVSVLVVDQISGDGESNWLEGVMLLMVYALIGILFFNLPG